jgi:hypothetical protein
MRFVLFTVRYDTEFKGWPTEGSTAALSHPSEGWHEKGHTSGQIPRHAERRGPSQAMFKSRLVYGREFFFSKNRQEALGVGRTNPGTP